MGSGETASSMDNIMIVNILLFCGGMLICDFIYFFYSGPKFWSSSLLANHHPSYYGMMVATFNINMMDLFY